MPDSTQDAAQGPIYGALPFPHVTPGLRNLIRTGHVFSLQHTMRPEMPQWAMQPAYVLTTVLTHDESSTHLTTPTTGSYERIEHSGHSGTHIDALCHIGCWHDAQPHLHGGIPTRSIESLQGYRDLGAEHFPPLVLRGILLDVAAAHGVERLPDLYVITAEDLRLCELRQRSLIEPGTAVLIRTGFESLWHSDPARYIGRSAGPGVEAARYLAERGAVATGSDTANYEVVAFPDLSVHRVLLYEHGIPIMENLRLDELAQSETDEFLFIALPIAFAGSTGSAIHPIAIS